MWVKFIAKLIIFTSAANNAPSIKLLKKKKKKNTPSTDLALENGALSSESVTLSAQNVLLAPQMS